MSVPICNMQPIKYIYSMGEGFAGKLVRPGGGGKGKGWGRWGGGLHNCTGGGEETGISLETTWAVGTPSWNSNS